ncbi:MAG: restriction endonuclease subunit S [Chitinophagales bacterium]|nr:restriction endonuclease subunit S [Chitinophagales bacterium]
MSKTNKPIPELRFPEFKNEGEWEFKALEDALDYERPDKYIVSDTNYQNEGTPVLTANKSFILGYTNEDFGIYKKLPAIIFDDFTVDSKLVDFPFKVKSSAIKILTPKKKDDLRFAYELISQIDFNAVQHKRYYISEYQKLKLPFPILKEQQKIASCLSSLDEVIEAHRQKLELLKDHKKGLMQNLFPKEGEKVPKLRFKGSENDGDWINETVGDVYDFKVTNSFAREYLNYENGMVKNIHYGDIHTKFNTLFDITREDVPYINPDVSIEKIRKECYCIAGDIVFADASEDMNDVGKSIEIVNLNKEKLVSGLHTLLARQKEKKLAIGFGGYLFKSDWVRKQIQREAQGAKVLGISATRISNVQIAYPKNHKEQEAISRCLSSLDALITAQVEKIDQLKQHKKGLMQGLFPKMSE